jgi:adenosylcobinamide-phosphate synthase
MTASTLPTTATGLVLGTAVDRVIGDPRRGHPVAAFGWLAGHAEHVTHRDSRAAGAAHLLLLVGPPLLLAHLLERRTATAARALWITALTAVALGQCSLHAEALGLGRRLRAGDVPGARERLPALCGRDPAELTADDLARAVVESIAENTSDAVVGTLVHGAVGGAAGIVLHRTVNTLDAMIGHRSARYRRFGWAAARLDDLLGLAPSRLTALLTVALASRVGGRPTDAWRCWRRDAAGHPSPNAGPVEAATAGALDVRLGGATNRYEGHADTRPPMGGTRAPDVDDIDRAVALSRAVCTTAVLLAVVVAVAREVRP